MSIEVRPVSSRGELLAFIKLPFRLYKNDRNWVAPLISDQIKLFSPKHNPYYEHSEVQLFIAFDNGKVVGRITAHTNTQHNKFHQDKVGFFGFFESEWKQEIADALVTAAAEWNRKRGMDTMRGPMNLSVNDECGLQIEGYEMMPFIMMPHHFPYYLELLENTGMVKSKDLMAYYTYRQTTPERVERLGRMLEKRVKCSVRCLSKNKAQLKKDIETVFTIYTKAWERNWGFVPMTRKEFDHTVQTLLPIVDPELVFIAEVDGQPAGFSLALPDYNQVLYYMRGKVNPVTIIKALYYKNKVNRVRVLTMGVIHEYQGRGIDSILYYYSFIEGMRKGLFNAEFSWVLEDNIMMNRVAESLTAHNHMRYRILDLSL